MRVAVAHDFASWRKAARALLAQGIAPESVAWDASTLPLESRTESGPGSSLRVPRELVRLLEICACYDDPARWGLMYRLLWRVAREGPAVLGDEADSDLRRLKAMAKSVAKEVHRMHAFVRFREAPGPDGAPVYAAWFEPEHDVLAKAAPFFVERFAAMRWIIVTPRGAAAWDGRRLEIRAGASSAPDPMDDPVEQLWRTYYASIFNPARLNARLQKKEMPVRYWANLPEAKDIAELARRAAPRVHAMHAAEVASPRWSARAAGLAVPERPADALQACRRCPLWQRATQAVAGRGPAGAPLMLVGEQPGDEEDLAGAPFVGPAGRVLDRALADAGVAREAAYVTNAVKHFKWEGRGKRRMHRTPAQREVDACADWLHEELARVGPRVVVAMGATASYALTGTKRPLSELRAELEDAPLTHPSGAALLVTYHPAAVLRADDGQAFYRALCEDLRRAAAIAAA